MFRRAFAAAASLLQDIPFAPPERETGRGGLPWCLWAWGQGPASRLVATLTGSWWDDALRALGCASLPCGVTPLQSAQCTPLRAPLVDCNCRVQRRPPDTGTMASIEAVPVVP